MSFSIRSRKQQAEKDSYFRVCRPSGHALSYVVLPSSTAIPRHAISHHTQWRIQGTGGRPLVGGQK